MRYFQKLAAWFRTRPHNFDLCFFLFVKVHIWFSYHWCCLFPDLLIGVPLTLLLPTIGHNTEYKSRWREARQVDLTMEEEDNNSNKEEEATQPLLSRLDTFFQQLGVPEQGCRSRAICEIVQSKDQYAPLSDYLSSLLRWEDDCLENYKPNFLHAGRKTTTFGTKQVTRQCFGPSPWQRPRRARQACARRWRRGASCPPPPWSTSPLFGYGNFSPNMSR